MARRSGLVRLMVQAQRDAERRRIAGIEAKIEMPDDWKDPHPDA